MPVLCPTIPTLGAFLFVLSDTESIGKSLEGIMLGVKHGYILGVDWIVYLRCLP